MAMIMGKRVQRDPLKSDQIIKCVTSEFEKILDASWKVRMFKARFKWTLQEYSNYNKAPGETIESPEFTVGPNDETKWSIIFTPGGEADNESRFLSIVLKACNYRNKNVTAIFGTLKVQCCYIEGGEILQSFESGFRKFLIDEAIPVSLEDNGGGNFDSLLQKYGIVLKDDGIDIIVELSIPLDGENLESADFDIIFASAEVAAKTNSKFILGKLHKIGMYSDVTLCANGGELQGHRAILALRCPLFNEKFTQNPNVDRFEFDDVDFKVLKELVRFLYTNEDSPEMVKMAKDLYVIADRFRLDDLKERCEKCMLSSDITVEQVPDYLKVVIYYNTCASLKNKVIQFIRKNWKDVERSQCWKQLIRSASPKIMKEILTLSFQQIADNKE